MLRLFRNVTFDPTSSSIISPPRMLQVRNNTNKNYNIYAGPNKKLLPAGKASSVSSVEISEEWIATPSTTNKEILIKVREPQDSESNPSKVWALLRLSTNSLTAFLRDAQAVYLDDSVLAFDPMKNVHFLVILKLKRT